MARERSDVQRRTFLGLLGASAVGAAGCLGDGDGPGERTTRTDPSGEREFRAYAGSGEELLASTSTATEMDGDNTRSAATALSMGEVAQATLTTGDVDWYAVDAPADEPLTVLLDRESNDGVTVLALFDPAGDMTAMSYVGTGNETSIRGTTGAAGTYTVQVAAADGGTGDYRLAVGDAATDLSLDTSTGPESFWFEAEDASGDASFAPLEVRADADAAGGEYVVAPGGTGDSRSAVPDDGRVTFTFEVGEAAEFVLWGRTVGNSNGNSFYVRFDDGPDEYWAFDLTDGWTWSQFTDRDGNQRTVSLEPGTHTVTVTRREDEAQLDKLLVTADRSLTPSGTGGTTDGSGDSTDFGGDDTTDSGGDADGTTQQPYGGEPHALPGRVEAEAYDVEGFWDSTAGNTGGAFRTDDVDIEASGDGDGGYNVGWVAAGEWLEYTVDVPAGTYDAQVRVASPEGGGRLRLLLDGRRIGTVDVPQTGAWQTYTTVTAPDVTVDVGGEHVLRAEIADDTDAFNLDWLAFVEADDTSGTDGSTDDGTTDGTDGGTTGPATVSGERKRWHRVTLDFEGPDTHEGAEPNPFLDYRLDVTFSGPSGQTYRVPGFYAADGSAADTGASSGRVWRARFTPDEAGEWTYTATFVTGDEVAVWGGGSPTAFDGASGTITVAESDKTGDDFRARGALEYAGEHYLRCAGTGEPFVKVGADSPENFLAYEGFDGTWDADGSFLHAYEPHAGDWETGDPTWRNGRGKGIVGAINYLAGQGINSQYMLTYSVDGGDGGDVWPWTRPNERTRFDCSKLAQWERLFEHMNRRGVAIHLLTQETENDQGLDGGSLGRDRRLYYRELVARFAHHPALFWNLGEENTNTDAQRKAFARHVKELDPYDHFVCVHTYPDEHDEVYDPLLGYEYFDGPAMQTTYDANDDVVRWREASAKAGRPWVVMADELGDYRVGVPEDGSSYRGVTQDDLRRTSLWGSLLGGAGGVEWYFGYETQGGDLKLEDYRSRHQWWQYNRHAHAFVTSLPLREMVPSDWRLSGAPGHVLCTAQASGGETYAVYLDDGGDARVDVDPGTYRLEWFDPRTGEWRDGGTVDGGDGTALGAPPFDGDAAARLTPQ